MTKQRFLYVLDNDEDTIYDLFEKNILSKKDIENKMNALYEENEQLKQKVDFYKYFQKDARKLAKENEELKQELATYRKLISCSNCKYHNYDWYDDGDEFEVCDKGNDVTDGICKDWEEIE